MIFIRQKRGIIAILVALTMSSLWLFRGYLFPQNMPKAGIALSFDDRFIKEWYLLRPLFRKYNAHVTFYLTQPDSLSAEEWNMLGALSKDGHEIACHGAIHTQSIPFVWHNSIKEYFKVEIFPALNTMKKHGYTPTTFAHPGGSQFWWLDQKLYQYFNLLRDVSLKKRKLGNWVFERKIDEINEIYFRPNQSKSVSALMIDIGNELSEKEILEVLKKAKSTQSAVMLFGHKPLFQSAKTGQEYGFEVEFLTYILSESAKLGLKTYTMAELSQFNKP
ncbi:polysaccharide deacetylase family protein [Flectobacillus sp. BAB-3569]|uniref:polysaccharide deacetylase family protein n=1 Tax=Flectobacillus sp. BAB-3569 TaxID=1509483 RepID=UPI000BA44626|nr:polysaccharide deacetylase family protein [Flectobacillus sp. BAB-3569]PAC32428.1 polysaccharide deacetylase [Flectobacillus sp. BAB-3569]